ncbi:MAG: hypothetical protein ABSH32_34270 [Bryobacteraceae bacterium]
MRAIPKSALQTKIRDLDESEMEEMKLATDEPLDGLSRSNSAHLDNAFWSQPHHSSDR